MSKGIHVDLTGSDKTVREAYKYIATSGDQGLNGKNGKGSMARNNMSERFRNNYDDINWHRSPPLNVGYFQTESEAFRKALKHNTPTARSFSKIRNSNWNWVQDYFLKKHAKKK